MIRSVLAVVAGYGVVALATLATFALLFPSGPTSAVPGMRQLVFLLGAGAAFAVGGGYATGWIARRSEERHALALGILMAVLGMVSLVTASGPELLWFQVALILIPVPGACFGGQLRARRRREAEAEVGGDG